MNSTAIKIINNTDYSEKKYTSYQRSALDKIPQLKYLESSLVEELKLISLVLPFRVNNYVLDELINWNNVPEDPIFRLVFPQQGMLNRTHINTLRNLVKSQAEKEVISRYIKDIQQSLNPHPSGQVQFNIPKVNDEPLNGIQHKYNQTVLFFPSQGQYCHAYCTFCFRWAQFVDKSSRMNLNDKDRLFEYLRAHPEASDLLVTGGDPMVMKVSKLRNYLLPLLEPEFDHIKNIRIGSKSLSFWPERFISNDDSDELLSLFKKLTSNGKHVSFMAHINHPQEMQTVVFEKAVKRIQSTGVIIRTQSPLLKNINDNADIWSEMWTKQVSMNLIPYYMFVERDTGSKQYFEVPLAKAWEIFQKAYKNVSGLARTVRGPSMSTEFGKIEISGIQTIMGQKVFVLKFIQARDEDWVNRPFFAEFDDRATWFDQLKPAFGESQFFSDFTHTKPNGSVDLVNANKKCKEQIT